MPLRSPYFILIITAGLISVFFLSACSTSEPAASTDNSPVAETVDQADTDPHILEARSHFIRGVTAMELDDLETAEAHLTRAQSTLSRSPGVNYALAELYIEMEDYVNGIYYGRRAVDLEPDNKWYRLLLVEGYRATGDSDEVMNQLDSTLAYYPSDIEVLFKKARILSRQNKYEASNETYEKILELAGPDRSIYYQRISNFTNMDDTDAIIEELKKILELEPGNINTLLMLSQFYLEQEQKDKAREALEQVLQRNPRHSEAIVNLADIHINDEEWNEAGELLTELVGDTLVAAGNKLEIVQYITSRFSNDPENKPLQQTTKSLIDTLLYSESENGLAHAMAAEYFMIVNDEEQGLSHLQKTTDLMPENDAAWRQLIQTYYVEGRYDKAIETGKQADQHVPDDAFIHFFMGGSYFLKEQYEQAAEWLQSASELPSRSEFQSVIFGTLGDAYASLEHFDQADEAYEQSLSLDPDNEVALNNYAFYLAEREEQLEEAKEMATRAHEINPENPAYMDTVGWVYFKLGDYENAQKYIKTAIETGDASAEVMEHMGDVYDKMGKPDQALYWWQKSLENDESRNHLKERLHIN